MYHVLHVGILPRGRMPTIMVPYLSDLFIGGTISVPYLTNS